MKKIFLIIFSLIVMFSFVSPVNAGHECPNAFNFCGSDGNLWQDRCDPYDHVQIQDCGGRGCSNGQCVGSTAPPPPPPPGGTSTCTTGVCNTVSCRSLEPSETGTVGGDVCDANHIWQADCSKTCSTNAECPQNTDQPDYINASTSAWCYEFKDDDGDTTNNNRCLQLRFDGFGNPSCGGTGGSCTLGRQSPTVTDACASCIVGQRSDLRTFYNDNGHSACSSVQIVNDWCNGVDPNSCNSVKSGACASSCGGTGTRPALCQSMSISQSSISSGQTVTITSTANTTVSKFMYAFYNNDHRDPSTTTPQPIYYEGSTHYTPTDTRTATSDTQTFSYEELARPDHNFSDQVPSSIQINGYFFDSAGNQSAADANCVVQLAVAAPAPSASIAPTEPPPPPEGTVCYSVAESEAALATDCSQSNALSYNEHPKLTTYTLQDQTPGVKRIYVRFIGTKGTLSTHFKDITYQIPAQISNLVCHYGTTGSKTEATIKGTNFGAQGTNSKVTISGQNATITTWDGIDTIVASINSKPEGQLTVEVTTNDGRTVSSTCTVGLTTVSFNAKNQCKQTGKFDASDVSVKIYDLISSVTKPIVDQKVSLEAKEGAAQGFNPQLEIGKDYAISVDAPQTLTEVVQFKAEEGTTVLPDIILPPGDISGRGATVGASDGVINSVDYSEMVRQWNLVQDVTRTGDLNADKRVNSVDYSCMVLNFNDSDEKIPEATSSAQLTSSDNSSSLF
ncbi:IPT/TIG domain-containing protein [Candidatus Daviesbacteria bacterium]|nr:IPT/TIG domain-containing protein [Candidatus Daviesbacteria bacterium]